jgi:hypothetical protein
MKPQITNFTGFLAHPETDHTETDMSKIVGTAEYDVEWPDGTTETLYTGLRPGENFGWNLKVIEAAQAWRDAGGVIPAYVAPTPDDLREAMPTLTARQFRLGLVGAGRSLSDVDNAIAAIPDQAEREAARIEWLYATTFRRSHPLVISLAPALGFTPEALDTLWTEALTL